MAVRKPEILGGVAQRAGLIKNRLPLIALELDDSVMDAVEEAAERVVEGAKDRVPYESGDLHDSIHVETEKDAPMQSAAVGYNRWVSVTAGDHDVYYGHMVEFGTTHTSARPFLIPAFESERDSISEIVGEAIDDLI